VLTGECYAEGSMPFAPFAQMIQEAFADVSADDLDLPDFVLEDLITIAPALRALYPDLPLNPLLDPQTERQRVFESVVTWCTALAARAPLLLFVDDAHWAGSDTLHLLRHLARRTRNLRLLIVMTYREIELHDASPLQALLQDLNRERLVTRVKLTRLDRQQTRDMLVTILAPRGEVAQSLADAIYRETEGNPFFVEEVCKALVEEERLRYQDGHWVAPNLGALEIPQSVRVTVQSRLARLPVQTQDVLRIAAILGREFDFETLKQASELDEETLIDALEGAERAQIIEVRRGAALTPAFAFAHSIIPATLREGISILRRQRLHRRAAAAIKVAHPDDFEALAYHYEHGGDPKSAHLYYTRAADRALAVYAHQEAERHYRAALELTDSDSERAPLLSGLGEALFRQGRYERAGQTWCEAIVLYRASSDHDNLARLYARAARAAWYAGDPPRGLELCREGTAAIPEGLETPGVVALIHETARACFFNDLPDEALALGQQALKLSQRLGLVEVQADTLATLGLLPNQPFEAKRQALTQAVELAESAGLLATASRAHLNLGGRLQEAGQLETARQHFLRARELAQQMGIAAWEHDYLATVADVSLTMGDFAAVEEALVTLRRLEGALPNPERAAFFALMLEAELTRRRGEWDAAIPLLQRSQDKARQQDSPKHLISINMGLADTYMQLDRLAEAEQALTEALQTLADHPDDQSVTLESLFSLLRTRQGCLGEAHRLLAQARDHLMPEPNPGDQAALSWAEAHLAAAENRWPAALAAFEDALEHITRAGDRWYRARILADLAAAHLSRAKPGDRARAQELRHQALQIFQDLQVPRYVALIQERLPA
jgi:tetratricopeptide (TPR) repeat protein